MGTDDQTSSRPARPRRLRRGRCAAAALAAWGTLTLVVAPGAGAGDVTSGGECFASGQVVTISGTQFTPGAPVTLAGDVTGTAQADAMGAWSTQVTAPKVTELGPRTMTVRAIDGINPVNVSTLRMNVVRQAFGSNVPLAGRPRQVTTWRFAGFAPGQPIYAHFVLGGRSRSDYRFGVAKGDCGTLTARAPRMAGVRRLSAGRWTLKLDQRRTYQADGDGSTWRFRIVRRDADE
jgi:hypothetical protein